MFVCLASHRRGRHRSVVVVGRCRRRRRHPLMHGRFVPDRTSARVAHRETNRKVVSPAFTLFLIRVRYSHTHS